MIFIDSGAVIARHVRRDQHHVEAVEVWDELEKGTEPLATSNLVLVESVTFIARRTDHFFAADCARSYYDSTILRVVRAGEDVELDALKRMEQFSDQRVGLIDCLSFAIAERLGIDCVFTFDHHFRIAGFEVVP